MRRRSVLAMLAGAGLRAQSSGESFKVYTAHPRLLLSRRRLRLLQRERQRQSSRWMQFETLIRGKARMPEPGFALALFHQVSGELAAGRQAIAWAQAPSATDLRQIALVFDWCQGVLSGPERREISAKLRRGIDAAPAAAIAGVRSRVYAALALAGEDGFDPAGLLERVVREWWRGGVGPALKAGSRSLDRADMYPLFELLHALRDNFEIDLREGAPSYFRELPVWLLLSYYPSPYPAAENDYRIPFYAGRGQPDLRDAMLARAAEMAFLAYESNATETQFLQGWVMQDRFGSHLRSIRAAIGPSIGVCCYEVNGTVLAPLKRGFPYWADVVESVKGTKAHLDLRGFNRRQLEEAGISPDRIETVNLCTACHQDLFYSYRRDGARTGRMMSGIGLTAVLS